MDKSGLMDTVGLVLQNNGRSLHKRVAVNAQLEWSLISSLNNQYFSLKNIGFWFAKESVILLCQST